MAKLYTLISHPLAIRERIRQLNDELKLARKMLALSVSVRTDARSPGTTPPNPQDGKGARS